MTRSSWTSFLIVILFASVLVSAQEPGAHIKAHPHFTAARAENVALRLPPFETPPSLACIYGLVSQLVAGCPVRDTSAVPMGGSGIIAVINAFDYPTALQDLNVFSKRFGVQPCDSGNPCFQKVYATGVQPPTDGLWAANAAAVIEYAHAFAPSATVILVEGATDTIASLNRAVKVAHQIIATHGGKGQVIMPFGAFEFAGELDVDALFTAPGVVYISGSSSGINGELEYPAVSPNVLTVGGTAVLRDDQGNMTDERAAGLWAGAVSNLEPRPPYQDAIQQFVRNGRGIPDVAFAADAFVTPMLIYDSTDFDGFVGWQYTGHVGFGEAVWASILSRNGNVANSTAEELTILYGDLGNISALRDITWGSVRGIRARTGWDFLTGVGVPVGLLGN